ncbi:SET and MYND domain-containing protein [Apis cerana cerana]|uniref:SET and MYND domain-containing protein n=1 Tax=Apis cerana cerana TaxID=94128 RepID=A0A2A3E2G7_APICC|nr:SET and MYND domain-containing protein [Apis cerana cerana]
MAESERFYKTLCSLETVRSEKRGFFRDFSEDVVRVAGEQWISKVFGRLTTDEERVRTVFTDGKIKDAVLETLNRTEILYRDKNAMASRARRLEGFEALAAEERRKALLLFSQAILRAPLPVLKGGENPRLPGASTLLDVEETVNAGKRVIAAKNIEPGDRLIIESPHAAILLPEFFGTHCQHCFSRLALSPSKCPFFRTAQKLEYVIQSSDRMSGLQQRGVLWKKVQGCSFGQLPQIRVQNSGPVDRYITRLTKNDLSPDPRSEKPSSVASSGSGMSVLSMLALRMATQVGPVGCLRVYRALNRQDSVVEEIAESSPITTTTEKLSKSAKRRSRRKKLRDSRRTKGEETVEERREIKGGGGEDEEKMVENVDLRVYDLVMHEKRRTAKDFFERSLMAAFLFKCLQKVGFFDNPSSNEEA